MKIFKKIRKNNGRREIYFFGLKVLSYKKHLLASWRNYDLSTGIIDYKTLPITPLPQKKKCKDKLTIVYPVYYDCDNHDSFVQVLKEYEAFDDSIKERLKIIIVDDGSKHPVSLPDVNLDVSLLRVRVNIPWNNSGARNLGACYADTEKIILADIDWIFPPETLQTCLDADIDDNTFVVFESYRSDRKTWYNSVHPSLYCVKKQTFFKYGGYDESFCGFYGEDLFYRKHIMRNGAQFIRPQLKCYNNFKYNEHSLSRNLDKIKKILSKDENRAHSGKILQFPWIFVEEKFYKKEEV